MLVKVVLNIGLRPNLLGSPFGVQVIEKRDLFLMKFIFSSSALHN